MTPKERQLAAIRREPIDRVPIDAIWIYNQKEIADYVKIDQKQVLEYLGLDGRPILLEYEDEFSNRSDSADATFWSTTLFEGNSSQYGTSRHYPLAEASSIKDIESYLWPDPARFRYDNAKALAKKYGDTYALRGPFWLPVFCKACDLFGMEEAMIKMMTEPAVFEAAIERITVLAIDICERYLEACGDKVDIFQIGDDFAFQRGMMISPAKWREFIKPRLSRLIEIGKQYNKIIWFHSCGDITDVLPDLIDIGIDVWETVQLHTLPISPQKLKTDYGHHITFFGGINTQKLPFAKPANIETEVKRCVEVLGKNGGYICGPDHTINADVPPENTIALFKTARECQINI
jgi:uroporphyrinogen decarboxylase